MNLLHLVFHYIAYYVAWFSCMTLAAQGYAWLSTAVVILCVLLQLYWLSKGQPLTYRLLQWIGILVGISTLIDSLLVFNGIIIYAANPVAPYATPPWMIATWLSFSVVLYATMERLIAHLVALGLLSFFGFALAFSLGAKMGAAAFPYGINTCFWIGAIWLFLLPWAVHHYHKMISAP